MRNCELLEARSERLKGTDGDGNAMASLRSWSGRFNWCLISYKTSCAQTSASSNISNKERVERWTALCPPLEIEEIQNIPVLVS